MIRIIHVSIVQKQLKYITKLEFLEMTTSTPCICKTGVTDGMIKLDNLHECTIISGLEINLHSFDERGRLLHSLETSVLTVDLSQTELTGWKCTETT